MFIFDWFADLARLPSEVRALNKKNGSVTKANVIVCGVGLAAAAGCGYAGWWGWCLVTAVVAFVALFFNGEVADLIGRLLKYAIASSLIGLAIGGIAMAFGAAFTPWCLGSAIALCIGAILWFRLD